MASNGSEQCPRCGEAAEQLQFVLMDPAAPDGKRTFECKNDDCLQARFYRSPPTGRDRDA